MLATEWSTRPYCQHDQDQVLDLLRSALGLDSVGSDARLWHWKHVANPFGPSYAHVANDENGKVVGLRTMMQWQFQLNGISLKAVRAVDTATSASHRRMGIFDTLTRQVLREASSEGVNFVFNTPNRYSLPGYLKMGWHHVGTIGPIVCILNPRRCLLGLLRGRRRNNTGQGHSPEEFFRRSPENFGATLARIQNWDALLDGCESLYGAQNHIFTERSVEYLRWRYADHPRLTYYTASIEHDRHMDACVIFRTNTRYGLKEVILCELLLAKPDEELCRDLITELISFMEADYLIAHFSKHSFVKRALGRCGFRTIPRLGMIFAVKPLNPNLPVDPISLPNWALSLGDLELF